MEFFYSLLLFIWILLFGVIALYFFPIALWVLAIISGVQISMFRLVKLRIKRAPVKEFVQALIASNKSGILINRMQLEEHALSGGDVLNVVYGMILARQSGIELSFSTACAEDVKGVNLVEKFQNRNDVED